MQLNLRFVEAPGPSQPVWESLNHEQRQEVINRLSQLIAKLALAAETDCEEKDD